MAATLSWPQCVKRSINIFTNKSRSHKPGCRQTFLNPTHGVPNDLHRKFLIFSKSFSNKHCDVIFITYICMRKLAQSWYWLVNINREYRSLMSQYSPVGCKKRILLEVEKYNLYKHKWVRRYLQHHVWHWCCSSYDYCESSLWYTQMRYSGSVDSIRIPSRHTLQWRHNERVGVSNHHRLDCLLSRLFRQENIKAPRHWPLWGESTGDRWIPFTKGE